MGKAITVDMMLQENFYYDSAAISREYSIYLCWTAISATICKYIR